MIYYEVDFTLTDNEDFHQDLLIGALAEAGFDTFEETESGFKAFVAEQNFNEGLLKKVVANFQTSFQITFQINHIQQQNWNEVWESNFSPITISDKCYVRATFHPIKPEFPFEIVIDPKMAFGTGHHQTTSMMMEYMLEEDFNNKSVLDMGCGTGILAILANQLQAKEIVAIDNDPLCLASTQENSQLNNAQHIQAFCGSKEIIPEKEFDIILANINRNILIDQLSAYAKVLKQNGLLFLSGFYEEDLSSIKQEAEKHQLEFNSNKKTDNWIAVKFIKRL